MPVEVKRRNNESVESLLRRFTRKMQLSGLLIRAKKTRYYIPPKSKYQRKQIAICRQRIQTEQRELKRSGKLEEILQKKGLRKALGRKVSTVLPSALAETQRVKAKS